MLGRPRDNQRKRPLSKLACRHPSPCNSSPCSHDYRDGVHQHPNAKTQPGPAGHDPARLLDAGSALTVVVIGQTASRQAADQGARAGPGEAITEQRSKRGRRSPQDFQRLRPPPTRPTRNPKPRPLLYTRKPRPGPVLAGLPSLIKRGVRGRLPPGGSPRGPGETRLRRWPELPDQRKKPLLTDRLRWPDSCGVGISSSCAQQHGPSTHEPDKLEPVEPLP